MKDDREIICTKCGSNLEMDCNSQFVFIDPCPTCCVKEADSEPETLSNLIYRCLPNAGAETDHTAKLIIEHLTKDGYRRTA